MRCAILAMVMVLWAVPAEAQCVGGLCRVNPLKAPVADRVRAVVKALPRPIFRTATKALPRPIWGVTRPAVAAVVHRARATVRPVVLSHSYRTTAHEQWCMMCLGQHLRNFHGKTYNALDAVGYKNWVEHHEGLHDAGVYEGPTGHAYRQAGCEDGSCSTGRGFLRRRR